MYGTDLDERSTHWKTPEGTARCGSLALPRAYFPLARPLLLTDDRERVTCADCVYLLQAFIPPERRLA